MKNIEDLSKAELELLLKFPTYICLLGVNKAGKIDEIQKQSAIKFSHIKTYSSNSLLKNYYAEADKVFDAEIERLDNELPKTKEERDAAINFQLQKIEKILAKLSKDYAEAMHQSMKSFMHHVVRNQHSLLEDFVLPLPINGITN